MKRRCLRFDQIDRLYSCFHCVHGKWNASCVSAQTHSPQNKEKVRKRNEKQEFTIQHYEIPKFKGIHNALYMFACEWLENLMSICLASRNERARMYTRWMLHAKWQNRSAYVSLCQTETIFSLFYFADTWLSNQSNSHSHFKLLVSFEQSHVSHFFSISDFFHSDLFLV